MEFVSLADAQQMPGVKLPILDWPYVEGLRMDEAMHPLTILCLGLYGETLPNPERRTGPRGGALEVRLQERQVHRQDPLRRGATQDHLDARQPARVRLLLQRQPASRPSALEPGEGAAHRRVRQAPTLMFNGYGDQVASLYAGMDLRKYF